MSDLHYFKREWIQPTNDRLTADLCIYGASSAGVAAAIAARRDGKTVVVLQPGKFIGGLTTGGLGWTDYGRKHVIGGISREFYRRIGEKYGKSEEFQFEPSVASTVYSEMLAEVGVSVRLCQYLEAAVVANGRIIEITLLGGLKVSAKVYLDCSYEGDLMAKAGVSYHVGREGNATYGETLNGVYVGDKHQFSHHVDPYVVEGDPTSGLLPGISSEDMTAKLGQGDRCIQAYNFRMCMTDDPELKVDWQKPAGYDERWYVLAGRWLRQQKDKYNDMLPGDGEDPTVPMKFDVLPNKTINGYHKTDTNNHGAFSSDFIGQNHAWPEASYEEREVLFQQHVTYQKGLYWYLANSPDVPDRYRLAVGRWGLPKDEFTATEHWPHQLYVRESRRMIGQHVITEHDCRGTRVSDDPIGMGSYGMDSHNCCRFVKVVDGKARVVNEGDVQVPAVAYRVPYRSITPKRSECANLLVPVCFSASHIAYGSARMEPVFMVLGQSAGMAACLAIDSNVAVQDVKYAKLKQELLDAEQILGVSPDRRQSEVVA